MTLNLQLSPEAESRIRERAAAAGQDVETFVLQAVQHRLNGEPQASEGVSNRPRDHEAWRAKLSAWTALHPIVTNSVDDSREST